MVTKWRTVYGGNFLCYGQRQLSPSEDSHENGRDFLNIDGSPILFRSLLFCPAPGAYYSLIFSLKFIFRLPCCIFARWSKSIATSLDGFMNDRTWSKSRSAFHCSSGTYGFVLVDLAEEKQHYGGRFTDTAPCHPISKCSYLCWTLDLVDKPVKLCLPVDQVEGLSRKS
jgi:hypothetical protein